MVSPSSSAAAAPRRRSNKNRSKASLVCLALIGVLLFAVFCALGTWQVQRRAWKLDLIARVDQRVHAAPTPAPGPAEWPSISADRDEYRRVRLDGTWLAGKDTLVQAVTDLGSGFWVMTPLRLADGNIVLVNRGYIPAGQRPAAPDGGAAGGAAGGAGGGAAGGSATGAAAASPPASVTGLLRLSEPGGGFLRKNEPATDRWFSRDVVAIATTRGLPATQVAPYFVDADAAAAPVPADAAGTTPQAGTQAGTQVATQATAAAAPVGGLTVVKFPNSHLVYAITWYGMALMVIIGAVYVVRDERRRGER
ncbi:MULTISPECIES: SURF1 family protein [unclassified Achromobacter]|uniref:SURF1 family protein n=1 Tax=unclassified Achromobacter TaxID=2626865 RepID=UPI000B517075|nr:MULTISPECIES: SURF1 family protein [unclassified Achromobacter]OWT72925.1 Surfeit locus 1 family protein [Achromobacter sp. HZ34]OWT74143.1 Surfeit locus 1 family protein [Achromobacter sp. HZ28]